MSTTTGHTSSSYRAALVSASCRGDSEGVRSLLAAPAPPDVTRAMRSAFCHVALLKAAGGNHEGVVRQLLGAGTPVSAPNSQGATALHVAAEEGHLRVSLLPRGAGCRVTPRGGHETHSGPTVRSPHPSPRTHYTPHPTRRTLNT